MALIICPECNHKISDKAAACVHCGLPSALYFPACDAAEGLPAGAQDVNYGEMRNMLLDFDREYASTFAAGRFIAQSEADRVKKVYDKYLEYLKNPLILQYVITNAKELRIDEVEVKKFTAKMDTLDRDKEVHNERFVEEKLVEYQEYFDEILKDVDPEIKLDLEQRRAVLTDENHCLLVAGAGAGKTTTMAAKVKYLIDKLGVKPDDIIVISYTNKAIDELKDRINHKLKLPVKISTFHSFAFDIVKHSSDEQPEINFSSYTIIFDMLEKRIFKDKKLMINLVMFLGFYFDLPEDAFKFNSLNEYHMYKAASDYETLKSGLGQYIAKVGETRSKYKRTITGEYLRSTQEVQIANYLYLNNLDYEYEKPYPFGMQNARKKYTPDFYISQGEHTCYLEHYGLSEDYTSNVYTQKELEKYKKSVYDKREQHKNFKTNLIETWSQYRDGRPLHEHLRAALETQGFVLRPRRASEVYRKIVETGKDKYIYKLITFMITFIEQYKTMGYDADGFQVLKGKTENVRNLLFLDIAEDVYNHYQATLKQRNQLDFADMINDAYYLLIELGKNNTTLPYRYIVIDEFQDIARQRFNLTKKLAEVTKAKVVAVGDDWQSIYAFAGSDITLFTKFLELMGSGVELKITHTYRNSQELIDVAGNFVQKNSTQIRKKLISPKRLKDPIKLEFYDDSKQVFNNMAAATVSAIANILAEFGARKRILLIGRYNYDQYKLIKTGEFAEGRNGFLICKQYPQARVGFMTIHSAKGLGYDNVIILNMLENKYGFPCQIEDDPIMKMVRYEDRSMPYAEERRLFYVALTRTKNRVYILAPLHKPSRFLVEIVKDNNIPLPEEFNTEVVDLFSLRCPDCGFPLKYEYNKNYGLGLYICTNEIEVCDFMTNDKFMKKDIYKCDKCEDGYLIVKLSRKTDEKFYGCTNYDVKGVACKNMKGI